MVYILFIIKNMNRYVITVNDGICEYCKQKFSYNWQIPQNKCRQHYYNLKYMHRYSSYYHLLVNLFLTLNYGFLWRKCILI